jgi:hypothetical protein
VRRTSLVSDRELSLKISVRKNGSHLESEMCTSRIDTWFHPAPNEHVYLAVKSWTYIREILGSNLGPITSDPDRCFEIFLTVSR